MLTRLMHLFSNLKGNNPFSEAFRIRREITAPRSKPTYDAYPDLPDMPYMKMYIEARDAKGRLLREYVDLSGYSLHQINFRAGKWKEGLVVRIAQATYHLALRLATVAEKKAAEIKTQGETVMNDKQSGQGLAEYALILALIAIVAIASLILLGDQISGFLSQVGEGLNLGQNSSP